MEKRKRRLDRSKRSENKKTTLDGIKGVSAICGLLLASNVQSLELSDEVYDFTLYNSNCVSIICNKQETYINIDNGYIDFSQLKINKKCNPTHLDYIIQDEYGRDMLKEIHASEMGRNTLRFINCRTGLLSQKWVDIIGKLKPEIKITF